MEYLLTREEMKSCEEFTIEKLSVSAETLMELAGKTCAKYLLDYGFDLKRVLVVCGQGNNGGDGFVIARYLKKSEADVSVLFLGKADKLPLPARRNFDKLKELDIPVYENRMQADIPGATTIVDAIFGVGLNRDLEQPYLDAVQAINFSSARVLSVDIPSGIDANNGAVMGAAVRASATIAIGYKKVGMLLYPGTTFCGEIIVADIGIPYTAIGTPKRYTFNQLDMIMLPKRRQYSNKGDYGRVLVVGGSPDMCGASYFSAFASLRTGAGLVKVFAPSENRIVLQTMLPEAMLTTYDRNNFDEESLKEDLEWATTVVVGSGLGQSETAKKIVRCVMKNAEVPVVVDADAINLIAADKSLLPAGKDRKIGAEFIFTPHLKEMSRLCGKSVREIMSSLEATATHFAVENDAICVLKDARTVVSDGKCLYVNTSGCSAMAKGGSGDVLTGVVAGLIAQGMKPLSAATLGVYIHGLAGEKAAKKRGEYGVIASDVIYFIDKLNDFIR